MPHSGLEEMAAECMWPGLLKVPMKWNLFLFSIKMYLVKYAFPKFETSGIKKNDFTSLQSWAFCLPKMVRGMGRVNPKIPRRDVTLVPKFLVCEECLREKNVERLRNEPFIRKIQQHRGRRNWRGRRWRCRDNIQATYALPRRIFGRSSQLTPATIQEMQMISRKGNLMKTGLQQQLWKRDTKGKLLLTYVR